MSVYLKQTSLFTLKSNDVADVSVQDVICLERYIVVTCNIRDEDRTGNLGCSFSLKGWNFTPLNGNLKLSQYFL